MLYRQVNTIGAKKSNLNNPAKNKFESVPLPVKEAPPEGNCVLISF